MDGVRKTVTGVLIIIKIIITINSNEVMHIYKRNLSHYRKVVTQVVYADRISYVKEQYTCFPHFLVNSVTKSCYTRCS